MDTKRRKPFRNPLGGAGQPISVVTATPQTSELVVGQALQDTTDWVTFLSPANYTSSDPADIGNPDTVTVNYIGDTPDATTAFTDGQTNHFSITVTWIGTGNSRTFFTVPRTVVYALAVNTVAPTISGNTGFGDTVTIANGTWTGAVGGAFEYRHRRDTTPINGETAAASTLGFADSVTSRDGQVRYVNSGGPTAWAATSNSLTIPIMTPIVTSAIADQTLQYQDGSSTVIDLRTVFFNAASYSVTGTSASIEANGYELLLDDNTLLTNETITVTATNQIGSTNDVFLLTVLENPVEVISPIADQTFVQNAGNVTIDLNTVFLNATSYSVSGNAAASVAGSTLTLNDDNVVAGATITVTGTNTTNSADDVFTLTITSSDTQAPSVLSRSTATDGSYIDVVYDEAIATPISGNTWVIEQGSYIGTVTGVTRQTTTITNDTARLALSVNIPRVTTPAAMAAPSLVVDSDTQITATFAAGPHNGGSAITSYDLRHEPVAGGGWTEIIGATTPTQAITGLTASTAYNVQTRANNAEGNGTWSASATATTASGSGGIGSMVIGTDFTIA